MHEEQLVAMLCREKRCSEAEAKQIAEMLLSEGELPTETQALQLWETVFGHSNRNFGLSTVEFERLLGALQAGDPSLFEHIFLKHFKSCMDFLVFQKHLPQPLAYDATMDTLLQFRQMLLDGKVQYGNLRYLFTRIAVFAAQKLKTKQDRFVPVEHLSQHVVEDLPIDKESLDILHKTLKKLNEECQKMLEWYFYDQLSWRTIAETLGIKEENARKRGQRCREALVEMIRKFI